MAETKTEQHAGILMAVTKKPEWMWQEGAKWISLFARNTTSAES